MKRLLSAAVASLLLGSQHQATWSIVVVDTATGEVGVATATCLPNVDISSAVPVISVGIGAGATQSFVSPENKVTVFNAMGAGASPQEILDFLAGTDPFHQGRQYGFVTLEHEPVAFTGSFAGAAANHVTGTVGSLKYAVQGNVLTGHAVVLQTEATLLGTSGDLGQRMMAAMETARSLGGDGRCSCSESAPTSCGVPPASFDKSAHAATIVLGRIGDSNGPCTNASCVQGDYYLQLNVIGDGDDPDPVFELQSLYDVWRQARVGFADHVLSTVSAPTQSLPADGQTSTTVSVALVDVDGTPLTTGGATLTVVSLGEAEGGGRTQIDPPTDHLDGTYSFDVTANELTGTEVLAVRVDDGTFVTTLYPFLELELDPAASLHCGYDEVSAAAGASVPLTVDLGPGFASEPYIVLATASGTAPGFPLVGGVVPLNPDPLTTVTLLQAGSVALPNTLGFLDGDGRAHAAAVLPPGILTALVGVRFDWAGFTLGAIPTPTVADGFDIAP